MFLTADEVASLTGYQQAARQIRWLRDRRYPFEIGADGKPRVLSTYVQRRLGDATAKREPSLRLA